MRNVRVSSAIDRRRQQISEHRYVEQASPAVSRRGHIFDRLNLYGTIIDGGPDLIGDGFTIDASSVSPGESVTVDYTVTNQAPRRPPSPCPPL